MIPVVEDYLSELLTDKMTFLRQNPDALYKILGLSKKRLDELKEFIVSSPISIRRGFPRTPIELPCMCILLSSEEETQEGLGNIGGEGSISPNTRTEICNVVDTIGGKLHSPYIELTMKPVEFITSIYNKAVGSYIPIDDYRVGDANLGLVELFTGMVGHGDELEVTYGYMSSAEEEMRVLYDSTYRLEIWSKNADLTVELYHLAKWAILSGRDYLANDKGIFNQKLSGMDFQPAPAYFPEFVYRRALTFWCQFNSSTPSDTVEFITGVTVNQSILQDRGDTNV